MTSFNYRITVNPIGTVDRVLWVIETFGWDGEMNNRWIINDNTYSFRREEDYLLFLLRWKE